MKQAIFITHPESAGVVRPDPWKNKRFNSYDFELEGGRGLLTLMGEFSPDFDRGVERITLRATALGIFDAFINGVRIGHEVDGRMICDEYKPGFTDYRRRVFEYEYDITSLCSEHNRIVAEVSPGWWSGRISFNFYGSKAPAFAAEVEILYADGDSFIYATDESWLASICGPVLTADIWDGEYYDSTIPEPSIFPEAHSWVSAVRHDGFEGEIVALDGPPVRSRPSLRLRPRSAVLHSGVGDNGSKYGKINVINKAVGEDCETMTLPTDAALILDMGENSVGRPVLIFNAPRGTKIKVYFAEMLNDSGEESRGNDGPEGSLYLKNYRSALSRLVYVASGAPGEMYFPTHSFFGYRYIELRADSEIEVLTVYGDVIGSVLEESGSFTCSDEEINRFYKNVVRGMRSNYLSIPTDCPQRDERLGWAGDTQIFAGAASYLADIRSFMRKWLCDLSDSQIGFEGAYCSVAPRVFEDRGGAAAWADAGLIVPHRLWQMYGDEDIIRRQYDSMEYYMEYLTRFGLDGASTAYGDWLNYEITDKRYISISFYAYDAALMETFSILVDRPERAAHYRALRHTVLSHWREEYIENGKLKIDTQTGYLLALAFDLAPEECKNAFVLRLKEKIVSNGYRLSTGFVGTGILCPTLSKVGLDNLCYSLILQTEDPSWLYSVRNGATTVWERWNSYTLDGGFGEVSMNSFNHYAYGAVVEWFYSGMCGIKPHPHAPGFECFILSPTPDMRSEDEMPSGQHKITYARAEYNSVQGKIVSSWAILNGRYEYEFTIPAGTVAQLRLVCASDSIRINDLSMTLDELDGRRDGSRIVFPLCSGSYRIAVDN